MATIIPKSIILVDDDLTTNFLNRLFIDQLGYKLDVHVAISGKEALELLSVMKHANGDADFGPCLLILDIYMPIMDGWEFLKQYQERFDESLKDNVSIVVLSALGKGEDEKKALLNPNVKVCVKKPLSDIHFKQFITELF